jgi:hypothetical protein
MVGVSTVINLSIPALELGHADTMLCGNGAALVAGGDLVEPLQLSTIPGIVGELLGAVLVVVVDVVVVVSVVLVVVESSVTVPIT